jgi:DNA-binding response OmpR family regulator
VERPSSKTVLDMSSDVFPAARRSAVSRRGSVGRLLIVDDEPGIAEVVRRAAAALGMDAKATFSGKEFVTAFDEFRPTVVFLDMVMPDIDGFDIVTWLCDRKYNNRVLVASGHDERYARMAEQFGCAGGLNVKFLYKPFRVNELHRALIGQD